MESNLPDLNDVFKPVFKYKQFPPESQTGMTLIKNKEIYQNLIDEFHTLASRLTVIPEKSLTGELASDFIQRLQLIRHNIFHVIIATALGVTGEEITIREFITKLTGVVREDSPELSKTPDIILAAGSRIIMYDVAVSVNPNEVSMLKQKKYEQCFSSIIRNLICHNSFRKFTVEFHPLILQKEAQNIDTMILHSKQQINRFQKQLVIFWMRSCQDLLKAVEEVYLSDDAFQRESFYQNLRVMKTDLGSIMRPLPNLDSELRNKLLKDQLDPELSFPMKNWKVHMDELSSDFMKLHNKQSIFNAQLFEYPSPKLINNAFNSMEEVSRNEFKHIFDAKPSLNFSVALTQSDRLQHDRKLDIVRIQELKMLFNKGLSTIGKSTETTQNLFELLTDIFENVPDIEEIRGTQSEKYWCGEEVSNNEVSMIKSRTTINRSILKKHKHFLENFIGLGKKEEDSKSVTDVKSLPFWEPAELEKAEEWLSLESKNLKQTRSFNVLSKPPITGIPSIDKINTAQHNEIKDLYELINNTQASYVSKLISNTCMSMLVQRKREANHVQLLNKGDRGLTVITLPHRLLETKKQGNTIPYICLNLRKPGEEVINKDLIVASFQFSKSHFILDVTRGMRLDVHRIESLSHSYELFNSVALGWFSSVKTEIENIEEYYLEAVGILFYLCHSVHTRTGGMLDNLRYLFMDVTAEKSNAKMFIMDTCKMALKNKIQLVLYNRIKKILPQYSDSAKNIDRREPKFIQEEDKFSVDWGKLGVDNVSIPSIIKPGLKFTSFMHAINEIVGLFFSVPKNLHGEFHRMVKLESTPFEWSNKMSKIENKFVKEREINKILHDGYSKQQTVDLQTIASAGQYFNEVFLKPQKEKVLDRISAIRLHDSVLSHKQFTSSHSCIKEINESGYAVRDKVLTTMIDLIEDEFQDGPPSFWDFAIWSLESEEPFRFVISPKGQRTVVDREIYIGNLVSFSLRLVEKVFAAISNFIPNESIHEAGDKKFMTIQRNFQYSLEWSRNIARFNKVLSEELQESQGKFQLDDLNKIGRLKTEAREELDSRDRKNMDKVEDIKTRFKIKSHVNKEEEAIIKDALKELNKMTGIKDGEDIKLSNDQKTSIDQKIFWNTNIAFLNGDRSKWSAADVCAKFLVFIDQLTVLPEDLRILMKAILIKHDKKVMHISEKLHKKIIEDERDSDIKQICGSNPFAVIKDNWFQGMLNYTSSCLHASVQHMSMHVFRNKIAKRIPIYLNGLCHSDDEICFIGFGTPDMERTEQENLDLNDFELNPLESFLVWHNVLGTLSSMNYSQKKTNVHFKVSEFISLFLIWGDQQFPFMKHLATAISGLPGTGLDDDMYSCLSQIMMAASRGCPLSILWPILQLGQERIDRLYSIGPNMHNDVEKLFGMPRHYLPLELGGRYLPGPLGLMLGGPALHDVMVCKMALEQKMPQKEWNSKALLNFHALSKEGLVQIAPESDPLAQETAYVSSRLSGFTGMLFKNYLPKKKDDILERHLNCKFQQNELELMILRPCASVIKPSSCKESMLYWHSVIRKPAWIRAVRKEGSRGMSIKRAQWVKGPNVKLRHDEEWRTLKDCLEEINAFSSKKMENPEIIKNLKDYVYNISSDSTATLNYLAMLHVSISKVKVSQTKLACELTRPMISNTVRNDIKKIIMYIYDKENFQRENMTVRFHESFNEDVAIVKTFFKPSTEIRKGESPLKHDMILTYNQFRKCLQMGNSWDYAVKAFVSNEAYRKRFFEFIKEVYMETSWLYKQFGDKGRQRIVITAAGHKSYRTIDKIVSENCLMHQTLSVIPGTPFVKYMPSNKHASSAESEFTVKEIIDTMAFIYKGLVAFGLDAEDIRIMFNSFCLDGRSFYDQLKDVSRFVSMNTPEHDVRSLKLVAVMQATILGQLTVIDQYLAENVRVLEYWPVEQRRTNGRWLGPFKYKCWIGQNTLEVSGTDCDNLESQNWEMKVSGSQIAQQLVQKAYFAVFGNNAPGGFARLRPKRSHQNESKYYFGELGGQWKVSQIYANMKFIPSIIVNYDPSLETYNAAYKINASKNLLELWQENPLIGARHCLFKIKHTRTDSSVCQKVTFNPFNSYQGHRIKIVKGINLEVVTERKLLDAIFSHNVDHISMKDAADIFDITPDTTHIDMIWKWFKGVRYYPRCPTGPLQKEFGEEEYELIEDDDFLGEFNFSADTTEEEMNAIWQEQNAKLMQEIQEEGFISNDDPADWNYLSGLNEQARKNYMGLIMNKFIKGKPALYDPTEYDYRYTEIMPEELIFNDEGDRKTESSGSSSFTVREQYKQDHGNTFAEKICVRLLGLDSYHIPTWIELCFFMANLSSMRNLTKLKNEILPKGVLFIWSCLCEFISIYGMEPQETFEQLSDNARMRFLSEMSKRKRETGTVFEHYREDRLLDLIDLTYDVPSGYELFGII